MNFLKDLPAPSPYGLPAKRVSLKQAGAGPDKSGHFGKNYFTSFQVVVLLNIDKY